MSYQETQARVHTTESEQGKEMEEERVCRERGGGEEGESVVNLGLEEMEEVRVEEGVGTRNQCSERHISIRLIRTDGSCNCRNSTQVYP